MRIKLRILWVWALALLIAGMPLQQAAYAADSSDVVQSLARTGNIGSTTASPIISSGIDTTSTRVIRVIVQLSTQSASVGRYASQMGIMQLAAESTESAILKEQSSFITAVKNQGIPMKVNRQFNTVLNGMEVTLPANQVPALAKIPGVKSIHENRTFYPIPETNTTTVTSNVYPPYIDLSPLQQMGLEQVWNMGYTGEGLKVGVLDTGVDYEHPDLKPAYKGGYNSINNNIDPYEDAPIVDTDGYTVFEGSFHGTHVTGTIVGRAVNTGSDVVQKGVAYKADLYSYKVLGGIPTSGTTAQVVDGIERAVKDGMNVLNLSLGSDSEKDPNAPESIAINNAVLSGVVVVVANGNAASSGPYYYSMGSPASSQLAISVGAATSSSNHYTNNVTVSGVTYSMQLMGWRTGQEDFSSILGTAPIDGVYVGLGFEDEYAGKDVSGKVAFVSRGDIPFTEKIKRAKDHGAKAIVIFNGNAKYDEFGTLVPDLSTNISGRDDAIGSFLGDSMDMIPAFDMSGIAGRALAAQAVADPGMPLQFTFGPVYSKIMAPGDKIASFSSRGPNSDGSLGIKPDLAAPGVNILSTWPAYGKINPGASYSQAYNRISGTSMATPHVTGASLLLKQEHPNWTPFDIRAALANTAVPLFDANSTRYDVYSQGAGRINVLDAVYTPAILQTVETLSILDKNLTPHDVTNYGANASFGVMAAGSGSKTKSLQLKNSSGKAVKYAAKVVMNPSVTSDPGNPVDTPNVGDITPSLQGLDTDNSITVDANSTKSFSLTVSPNANAAEGVYEGQVVLDSPGVPSLHLPFVLHVGTKNPENGFGLQDLTMTKTVISPNGDKINDSTDISFTLTATDANYVEAYLVGLDDLNIGTLGRLQKTDGSPFTPGLYTFRGIDGSYVDGQKDATGKEIIKHLTTPGVYKLVIWATLVGPDGTPIVGGDGYPIVEYSITKPFGVFTVNDVPAPAPIGGGGGAPLPPSEPTTYNDSILSVVEQGQLLVAVKPTTTTKDDTLMITIPDAELDKSIKSASGSPVAVIVDAASQADSQPQTKLSLTSSQIGTLTKAAAGSAIVINTKSGSVAVPASILNSVPAGASVEIAVSKAADQASVISGQISGSSIIGTPVSYEVRIVEGDKSTTPIQTTGKSYVKRSFTIEDTVDANKTGILYMENGKVFPVPGTFTTKNGVTTVTVSRPGFSVYAAATRQVKFEDIDSSWAKTQIETLASKFLLNGTSDNQFSPKETVTRAQFSAMLVRALGLQATKPAPFKDVNMDDWFASDIAAAFEAGLVNGVDTESFAPQATISRQDLTVMLARAVDLLRIPKKSGSTRVPYADTTGFAPYAADSIQKVSDIGLMSGVELKGSTYFLPTDPTTREAAAMVLYSLLQNGKLIN